MVKLKDRSDFFKTRILVNWLSAKACIISLTYEPVITGAIKSLACLGTLGMENGAISDGQITASSQLDSSHAVSQGRLHVKATAGKAGSWSAGINDANQWLQIDIGSRYANVTRVATQGRNGNSQWVTKYKLQYSIDGVNFQYYKEQGQTAAKVKVLAT